MSVSLFIHLEVEDFDQWLNPDPEVPSQMMWSAKATSYSLHRDLTNPNALIIACRFANEQDANGFVEFIESLPGETENFGARPGTFRTFTASVVPGFDRTLVEA